MKYTLVIKEDRSYLLCIFGKLTPHTYHVPLESKESVAVELANQTLCIGNNETSFVEMAETKGGKFTDRTGKYKCTGVCIPSLLTA